MNKVVFVCLVTTQSPWSVWFGCAIFLPETSAPHSHAPVLQGLFPKPGVRWRRRRDSNPRDGFPSTPLAGERLRPLGHVSAGRSNEGGGARQGKIGRRVGHPQCRSAPREPGSPPLFARGARRWAVPGTFCSFRMLSGWPMGVLAQDQPAPLRNARQVRTRATPRCCALKALGLTMKTPTNMGKTRRRYRVGIASVSRRCLWIGRPVEPPYLVRALTKLNVALRASRGLTGDVQRLETNFMPNCAFDDILGMRPEDRRNRDGENP